MGKIVMSLTNIYASTNPQLLDENKAFRLFLLYYKSIFINLTVFPGKLACFSGTVKAFEKQGQGTDYTSIEI